MANYSLVVNSTFQPFTYQELAAPLDRQELYHEKLAEEYDKLSSQADVLEAMGANDRDKESGAYSRYKSYSDALRREANDLYRFGLNTESRQRLSDLRRRYNTDIVPIQNAWTTRKQEVEDQMKARLQNPSLMFTREATDTSLDDYIRNPTGGYGVISGANITAQMAGMAKNLAKQVRSGYRQNIDDYTYNYIEKYGLDENLIRNWQDSPTLSAMFKQVMESNGVTSEALAGSANMQSIMDKSAGYAEMGMWNAMGEDKSHIIEDYGSRLYAKTMADNAGNGQGAGLMNQSNLPIFPYKITGMSENEHNAKMNALAEPLIKGWNKDKTINAFTAVPTNTDIYWRMADRKEAEQKAIAHMTFFDNHNGILRLNDFYEANKATGLSKSDLRTLYDTYIGNVIKEANPDDYEAFVSPYNSAELVKLRRDAGNYFNNSPEQRKANAQSRWERGKNNPNFIREFPTADSYYEFMEKTMYEQGKMADRVILTRIPGSGNRDPYKYYDWNNKVPTKEAYTINAFEYRLGNDESKNALAGLLSKVLLSNDKVKLHEIESISRTGAVKKKTDYAKKKDFIDDKGNIIADPTFLGFNTEDGKDGLMMMFNGKRYWIDADDIGGGFNEGHVDVETLNAAIKQRDGLIAKVGEAAYYNSPEGARIESAIENSGGAITRIRLNALAGRYKTPVWNPQESNANNFN